MSSPPENSQPPAPWADGPDGPGTPHLELLRRLESVTARVAAAAREAGRDPGEVRVLLATKTVDPGRIRAVLGAGHALIGENRVQELVAKAPELADLQPVTHFIGHLQSNKVNAAIPLISCLQTVDSARLARAAQERLDRDDRTLDVLVQVNVSGEESKYGLPPADVEDLVRQIAPYDRLRVRGLMTIGLNSPDQDAVRAGYADLCRLRDRLRGLGIGDFTGPGELSMGMSGDFELAVAEGATIVRLGSAVFGARAQ